MAGEVVSNLSKSDVFALEENDIVVGGKPAGADEDQDVIVEQEVHVDDLDAGEHCFYDDERRVMEDYERMREEMRHHSFVEGRRIGHSKLKLHFLSF